MNAFDVLEKKIVDSANRCTDCNKCSDVCPVKKEMEVKPAGLVGLAKRQTINDMAREPSLWVCINCMKCSEACPEEIDVAKLFSIARRLSLNADTTTQTQGIKATYTSFLDMTGKRARINELFLKRGSGKTKSNDEPLLRAALYLKGRLPLLKSSVRDIATLHNVLKKNETVDASPAKGTSE